MLNARTAFYVCWTLLTVAQAYFTELIDDEAYYWVYAQHLDWGHFHQPPMVALLIKVGYTLLPTAFGVRLLFVLLHLGTIRLIEALLPERNDFIFIALVASVGLLHVGGFWAVPDTPFVFFTVVFLWLTRRYLEKDSLKTALWLGVVVAGLLYSKYHGVVVIFFVMMANLALFRRWTFYVAGIFGLLLFLPHLYWEWQNDFVTLNFHWSERNKIKWHVGLTLTYLASVVLILGPLVGVILLKQTAFFKVKTDFERTLKVFAFGLIGFFFVMSLRGPVEANWVISSLIPMFVLTHKALINNDLARKWLFRLLPLSLIFAVAARGLILFDLLPSEQERFMKFRDFHGVENWVMPLREAVEKAGDYPPIFSGSYQIPSKYSFYTQKFATAMAASTGPRTQFDLYHWEQQFVGDTVLFFSKYSLSPMDSVQTSLGLFYYKLIPNFRSYSSVKIKTADKKFQFPADTQVEIPINFELPEGVNFEGDTTSILMIQAFQYGQIKLQTLDNQPIINVYKQKNYPVSFRTPKEKGTYQLNLSIQAHGIFPTHNTPRLTLVVE